MRMHIFRHFFTYFSRLNTVFRNQFSYVKILKRLSKKYLVAVNYNKSEKEAMELKKEILEAGGNCEIFKADIGKYDEVVNMINEIRKRMGNISVLINNAGISKYGLIQDISVDEWKKIFNVNVEGMFFTVKNVVPDMIKRKKGIIINISSMWVITGSSYETLYSSTKGAVKTFQLNAGSLYKKKAVGFFIKHATFTNNT